MITHRVKGERRDDEEATDGGRQRLGGQVAQNGAVAVAVAVAVALALAAVVDVLDAVVADAHGAGVRRRRRR